MRLAAYCRVSTEKEEQLDSLNQQKSFFNEYAARHNHKLVKLYADEGISGKLMKKREQFMRMLSDAKLDLFDTVVVKDISRFARNTEEFLHCIRKLKAMGVGVQFLSNNLTSLGDSEFILTIFSALAQEESANLSKRVKFGKNINAQKGKVPNIVFGYDQVDKFTLTINEIEANVVRTIFRMYLDSGLGAQKIAEYLEANAPVKSKRIGKWSQAAVCRILQNEIYTGVITNKKSEVIDFITGKRKEFDESQWLKTDKPELAIISREDYDKAQEIRASRHDCFRINKTRHSSLFPFSTLIKCEHCGYSFRRTYRDFKYGQYRKWSCSGRNLHICDNFIMIDEEEMLAQILEYFKTIIKDKDEFIQNVLAECDGVKVARGCGGMPVDKGHLEREFERLTKSKERAMEMYTNEVITMEELKERTGKLNTELAAVKQKLDAVAEREAEGRYKEETAEAVLRRTFDTIEEIIIEPNLSNEVLKSVIDRIAATRYGEVTIHIKQFED